MDDPTSVAAFHTADPVLQLPMYRFNALAMSSLLPEGGRVLDLGCGSGRLLAHLATARSDVSAVGTDLADNMLAAGRASLQDEGLAENSTSVPDDDVHQEGRHAHVYRAALGTPERPGRDRDHGRRSPADRRTRTATPRPGQIHARAASCRPLPLDDPPAAGQRPDRSGAHDGARAQRRRATAPLGYRGNNSHSHSGDTRIVQVAYRNFAISPGQVTVHVGQRIRWTNYDIRPHDVAARSGAASRHRRSAEAGPTRSRQPNPASSTTCARSTQPA